MHGKPSFDKKISRLKRANKKSSVLTVGDWQLKQNDSGDLVVRNTQTGTEFILARS